MAFDSKKISAKVRGIALSVLRGIDPGPPRLLLVPVLLACAYLAWWQLRSAFLPLMGEHNWRQADTYSVAYNFVHESADFFHPRIDWSRGRSGIMGMEAPVYAFVASLAMRIFGDGPAVARLTTWLIFVGALAAACHSLRPAGRREVAVGFLVMVFFSPMFLFEFRQVQPDGTMISLSIIAAALLHEYSKSEKLHLIALGLLAYTLAILTKSPALVMGPAMWMFTWTGKKTRLSTIALRGLWFLIPIAAFVGWELWSRHLTAVYAGGDAYFGTGVKWSAIVGDLRNQENQRHIFFELLPSYVTSWVLFPAVVAGLVLGFEKENRPVALPMLAWLAGGCLLCAIFSDRPKSHWYYTLLVGPPIAYFGSIALGRIFRLTRSGEGASFAAKWAAGLVVVTLLLAPLAGGPLRELEAVHASSKFYANMTWGSQSGFYAVMLLEALAVVLTMVPAFRRGRIVYVGFVVVGVALGLWRAAHDSRETLKWRSRYPDWEAVPRELAELREQIDAYSTRKDLFVVVGDGPWHLYRPLRKGWVEKVDALDPGRVADFVARGARFALHFTDNGELPASIRAKKQLAKRAKWGLYCLDAQGCPPLTTR